MIFYPYGPAFNLINHSRNNANVKLQWSSKPQHHSGWLDLDFDEFWKITSPGGLILEVVALTDLAAGAELLLDYGADWERAWQLHVQRWKPTPHAQDYVYPAEIDETEILRTLQEQKADPYPANLATMCTVANWDRQRDKLLEWTEPTEWAWWEGMAYCHIMEKELDPHGTGDFVYTVNLVFSYNPRKIHYNPDIPYDKRFIDKHVPRRAIRFVEIPYLDDEHLPNAFRHPMEFPAHLVSDAWRNKKKAA